MENANVVVRSMFKGSVSGLLSHIQSVYKIDLKSTDREEAIPEIADRIDEPSTPKVAKIIGYFKPATKLPEISSSGC